MQMETEMPEEKEGNGQTRPVREPVWTFRGYEIRPSEFMTAMAHFYRGEVQRANTWRNRLDTTTNWAIITAGAALSFALSDPTHHHGVILLNVILVLIFLFIEARRYRYFELWSYRVRLLETDFLAAMLVPPFHPSADWAETLADSLLRPKFPISMLEALGRRFRRNYFAIFSVLILVWLFKLYTQAPRVLTWDELVASARVGPIAGEQVLLAVFVFAISLAILGVATLGLQESTGEVLPHPRVLEGLGIDRLRRRKPAPMTPATSTRPRPARAWQRPSARREEFLSMIISDKGHAVAEKVMQDLNRGVTAIHGEGMYTQKPREVLMCALTRTEIEPMKKAVRAVDPTSFVVVMPAAEIAGRGFMPLVEEE